MYAKQMEHCSNNNNDVVEESDNNENSNINNCHSVNAIINNINNNSDKHTFTAITMKVPLPSFQRYEFPVLAEDRESVAKSRTDPLACNVNNEAVLIWNDVIIRRHDDAAVSAQGASISEATIEDVFEELQTTVAASHAIIPQESAMVGTDEVDSENLKEHLHLQYQRRHHHNRHHSRSFNHEDSVVSRRRLFDQGVDLPFISKLNRHEEHCDKDSNFINIKNSVHIARHNEYRNDRNCDDDSDSAVKNMDVRTSVGQLCNNDYEDESYKNSWFANGAKHLNESNERVSKKSDPDGVLNRSEFTSFEDSGVDKSYLDSGHFEDMSAELSPFRGSTGSGVFLEDDCPKNDPGVKDNLEFEEYDDEQYVSLSSDAVYSFVREEGDSNIHDNSDVFLDNEKDSNSFNTPQHIPHIRSNRSRRKPSHLKNHRRNREKSQKNRHKQNASSRKEEEKAWRDDASILVQCARNSCKKASNLIEARRSYKNCHHCLKTYYCSRDCRKQDWEKHKEEGLCHGSRVSSACKKVVKHCNSNPEIKAVLSRLAVRGYLAHGRGCVMLGFPDLESTEEFMDFGFPVLELNPIYVSAKELSESKMYGNVLDKLLMTCKFYKPDFKFVLNVGVGLRFDKEDFLSFSSWQYRGNQYCYRNQNHHEEMDTFGSQGSDLGYGSLSSNLNTSGNYYLPSSSPTSPKNRSSHSFTFDNSSHRSPSSRHKAPILQKFIKLKLSPAHAQQEHEKRLTFEKHFWDDFRTAGPTLILTSIPERTGVDIDQSESRRRELTFINIQRKLRERNVNLRQQYPTVHARLIAYVTKGVHFPSQILFPVDTRSGRTFTCFMMPEAEAELEWMQSHHLLNDLELSRNSLNKSFSKSLSSSMPSLHSQSQREDYSKELPTETEINSVKITNALRSTSLNRLSSFDNDNYFIEPTTPPAMSSSARSDLKTRENQSKSVTNCPSNSHSNVTNSKLKCTKNSMDKSVNSSDNATLNSQLQRVNSHNGAKILPLLQIDIINDDHKTIADTYSSPPSNETDKDLLKQINNERAGGEEEQEEQEEEQKEEELQWATNHDVSPSYYPVRKAKNVKLYSHTLNSHHKPHSKYIPSNSPKSTPRPKTEQQPQHPSQITIGLPQTKTAASLTSSQLLLPIPSPSFVLCPSTPANLSPALYTSTPKTSKAPQCFEGLVAPTTTTSPSNRLDHVSPSQRTQGMVVLSKEISTNAKNSNSNNENYENNNNTVNGDSHCYCDNCLEMDQTNPNVMEYWDLSDGSNVDGKVYRKGILKEYGFDSCYRNKVVVDEVDHMKRRRKDRKSNGKISSSLSSSLPSNISILPASHQDLEFYWFEDAPLQSPPLATSTLERRQHADSRLERGRRHSKRKMNRLKKRDAFSESSNMVKVKDDHKSATTHSNVGPSNYFGFDFTDDNNSSRLISCTECVDLKMKNTQVDGKQCEDSGTDCLVCRCRYDWDENTRFNERKTVCSDGRCDLKPHFTASSRRKFNTNSPYFPADFRSSNTHLSLSHPFTGHGHSRHIKNELHGNFFKDDGVSKDHGPSCTSSKLYDTSTPPSSNRSTSNNKDNDNNDNDNFIDYSQTMTYNSRTQSSPLDNTRKASTPKKFHHHRTSNNNNNNNKINITPINHHTQYPPHPPAPSRHHHRNHHHHRHHHHHHHLRMRIFDDVAHNLTNPIQDVAHVIDSSTTSTSKRKIKFNLPPEFDLTTSLMETNSQPTAADCSSHSHSHSDDNMPRHSTLKRQENHNSGHFTTESCNSSSVERTSRSISFSQLSPIRNVSYSSDW